MSDFVDLWGDPIEGSGWVRKGNVVERPKPGVPGTVERVTVRGGNSAPRTRATATSSSATASPTRQDGAPSWYLGPVIPVVERSDVERTAKHEAAHAAAAHLLGWEVHKVLVRADQSGETTMYWPADYPHQRRVAERAVISAAAEQYVGWAAGPDYDGDRRHVREARRLLCADRASATSYDLARKRYVAELVASPRFRKIARRVTDAVIDAGGVLKGEELKGRLGRLVSRRLRPCLARRRPTDEHPMLEDPEIRAKFARLNSREAAVVLGR